MGAKGLTATGAQRVLRSRLLELLDGLDATAVALTAPAGYGKTTLAEQWLEGRPHVVLRATPASADVAAFAVALGDALETAAPGAGDAVRDRISIERSVDLVEPLAELLAESLAEWPAGLVLFVDDYHVLCDSPPVERLVERLLDLVPLRLLVTTRRRPLWATARRILYGEVVELDAQLLAMTEAEATEALPAHPPAEVRALVERAQGWPAVVGLASLVSSIDLPDRTLSETLYRYFAEEVLRQEEPDAQTFMLRASVPRAFRSSEIGRIVAIGDVRGVVERLRAAGLLLAAGGDRLAFHPLLRDFLRQRLWDVDPEAARTVASRAISWARAAGDLDEAFELAEREGDRAAMLEVLASEQHLLLARGRIETLERWVRAFGPPRHDEYAVQLAQGQLLTWREQYAESVALTRALVERLPPGHRLASSAYRTLTTGLSLLGRHEEAADACALWLGAASSPDERRWALFTAATKAVVLGRDLDDIVDELDALEPERPEDAVLASSARVMLGVRRGSLAGLWQRIEPLLDLDLPLSLRMKALNPAVYLAVARADYKRARTLGDEVLDVADRLKIRDAIWPAPSVVAAHLGLREFAAARQTLAAFEEMSVERVDVLRAQLHVMRLRLALYTEPKESWVALGELLAGVPDAAAIEYRALLAFARAAAGEGVDHRALRALERQPPMIEATFCIRCARIVAAAEAGEDWVGAARKFVVDAAAAEIHDVIVTAYRAYPPLLDACAADPQCLAILQHVLSSARDSRLARQHGIELRVAGDRTAGTLTPREREVLELIREGLSNDAIARRLVISIATVKIHVHNILEKLGASSRLEAALSSRDES